MSGFSLTGSPGISGAPSSLPLQLSKDGVTLTEASVELTHPIQLNETTVVVPTVRPGIAFDLNRLNGEIEFSSRPILTCRPAWRVPHTRDGSAVWRSPVVIRHCSARGSADFGGAPSFYGWNAQFGGFKYRQ
jgi:hypothetical protein